MMRADRMLIVLWIVLTIGGIVLGLAVFSLLSSTPAAAANVCERHNMVKQITRGGRSWRCKRVRILRAQRAGLTASEDKPNVHASRMHIPQDLEPQVRTVRVIPIINGLTVHERIDRAFEMLVRFPIEDEQ